jgi:hypothetical protein
MRNALDLTAEASCASISVRSPIRAENDPVSPVIEARFE